MTIDNLNLSVVTEQKPLTLANGAVVNVKQYVTIGFVDELIHNTLEFARTSNGLFDDVLLDAGFFYNIIKYYTDIDVENTSVGFVYDALYSNNLADYILAALPEGVYDKLYDYLMTVKFSEESRVKSLAMKMDGLLANLPAQLESLGTTLENFNPENYEQVMNFIQAAGGDEATENPSEVAAE